MRCARSRISYASMRRQIYYQLFLPSSNLLPARICRRGFSCTVSTQNEIAQDSSTQNEAAKEPPTSSPAPEISGTESKAQRPSSLLPKSPLMNRPEQPYNKNRKKKATREEEEDLLKNPWAVALTSPVRFCSATRTRIPRTFMSDWGLIRQEGSEKLWMMPVGMMKDELGEDVPAQSQEGTTEKSPGKSTRKMMFRMFDSVPLLRELREPFSKNQGPAARCPAVHLIPKLCKFPHGSITTREEKAIAWKDDMADFVTEALRKEAVKNIVRSARRWKRVGSEIKGVWRVFKMGDGGDPEQALVEGLKGLEKIDQMECGGVVLMGSSRESSRATGEEGQSILPDYVALPQTQSKVPVFDLGALFSESEREQLRSFYGGFQNEALYLTPDGWEGVDALLALWKLKNALREFDFSAIYRPMVE